MNHSETPSFVLILLLILLLPASNSRLMGEEQPLINGVKITVQETKRDLKRFGFYRVEAQNTTAEQRTVTGRIILTPEKPRKGKPGSKRCIVYLKAPANSTVHRTFLCLSAWRDWKWKFTVYQVYKFILSGSSFNESK